MSFRGSADPVWTQRAPWPVQHNLFAKSGMVQTDPAPFPLAANDRTSSNKTDDDFFLMHATGVP